MLVYMMWQMMFGVAAIWVAVLLDTLRCYTWVHDEGDSGWCVHACVKHNVGLPVLFTCRVCFQVMFFKVLMKQHSLIHLDILLIEIRNWMIRSCTVHSIFISLLSSFVFSRCGTQFGMHFLHNFLWVYIHYNILSCLRKKSSAFTSVIWCKLYIFGEKTQR